MKPEPVPPRTVAIVLAAGLGTRMKSRLPKVLHDLCGRPMLGYVIEAARTATGARPLVVVSPVPETVQEAFGEVADFAVQAEPLGTADAVVAALAALPADVPEALVVYGDVPLLEAGLLEALLDAHRAARAALSLVSVVTIDPGLLGRLVRDDAGEVERIVEARDASEDELEIDEINAGIYAFDVAWLRERIGALHPSPATGELYLTELVGARPGRRTPDRNGRGRRRRDAPGDQRPGAAGRRHLPPAPADQRAAPPQRGDDARPVDGLGRRRRRPGG